MFQLISILIIYFYISNLLLICEGMITLAKSVAKVNILSKKIN